MHDYIFDSLIFWFFFSNYDPPTKKICLIWSLKAQRKIFFSFFAFLTTRPESSISKIFFFDAPWFYSMYPGKFYNNINIISFFVLNKSDVIILSEIIIIILLLDFFNDICR